MDPNEKLLSFSRFQIGLSKADLQPSSEVCMTRTQLEDSRSVVGQSALLFQPSAGCILWKLPLAFASKSGRNFLPMSCSISTPRLCFSLKVNQFKPMAKISANFKFEKSTLMSVGCGFPPPCGKC